MWLRLMIVIITLKQGPDLKTVLIFEWTDFAWDSSFVHKLLHASSVVVAIPPYTSVCLFLHEGIHWQ